MALDMICALILLNVIDFEIYNNYASLKDRKQEAGSRRQEEGIKGARGMLPGARRLQ